MDVSNNENMEHVVYIKNKNKKDLSAYINEFLSGQVSLLYNEFLQKGAVLFRGFSIESVNKFEALAALFSQRITNYKDGNSPRTKLSNNIYTSTEYPKEYVITQHNELSYSHYYPSYLLFCCIQPAEVGGQTPLADGRRIYRDMPANVVNMMTKKKLKYIRNLSNKIGFGKAWQKTFETEDKVEVENFLKNTKADFVWLKDGSIRLEQIGPVTIQHPVTQEIAWFNQPAQFHPAAMPDTINVALKTIYGDDPQNYPHHVVYGDNSEIKPETLSMIQAVIDKHTKTFAWKKGDVLLVDNILLSHGRLPYAGARKVLVSCLK
ncbi:MAG: TauD/TfdA family dioxygenase [Candidatus Aquirickettsiella sp.]